MSLHHYLNSQNRKYYRIATRPHRNMNSKAEVTCWHVHLSEFGTLEHENWQFHTYTACHLWVWCTVLPTYHLYYSLTGTVQYTATSNYTWQLWTCTHRWPAQFTATWWQDDFSESNSDQPIWSKSNFLTFNFNCLLSRAFSAPHIPWLLVQRGHSSSPQICSKCSCWWK